MNSQDYKVQRKLRGTQATVAAQLGVRQATISDRENGGEITREAWLALNALPKTRKAKRMWAYCAGLEAKPATPTA